ncbi:MAG: amidohydrolase family protein, partial [Wolinella sp.]
ELVLSVTKRAAHALGLESGELREGLKADLALFELEGIGECTQEALQWILHAKKVKTLYIEGKKVEVK